MGCTLQYRQTDADHATEPIVLLITIYMSFLYGLLYLSLTAYGIVFNEIYGFSLGISGLPYFGMIVGVFIAIVLILMDTPRYNKKLRENGKQNIG